MYKPELVKIGRCRYVDQNKVVAVAKLGSGEGSNWNLWIHGVPGEPWFIEKEYVGYWLRRFQIEEEATEE